jgi:hypothetical protein
MHLLTPPVEYFPEEQGSQEVALVFWPIVPEGHGEQIPVVMSLKNEGCETIQDPFSEQYADGQREEQSDPD